MKITVRRSGGFAGLTREWTVFVDSSSADSSEWMPLLSRLPWDDRPRLEPTPDRYVWIVRVSRRRITLPESRLEGPWRELVERVQARAD
ncbi:hypothetical protein EYE40_02885 [Glaciihabitans arcticus]|uniref:Uncharacterized protein n=1 Tax=Glaciihabitans arcticus TaxID=2668039 RepID=A0A4Q9GS50_9MICO|nr:protealysin inhibitor emfourin [Glaciihabitans arcticus]TBN56428.1 hypothetical protein EYE40_02885 [Glaciihabitans arcticus]